MDELSSTTGIVALAAAGVALLAIIWAIVLTIQVRRLRAAQSVVLGDGSRDLAQHSADLDAAFRALRDHVEEVHGTIDERLTEAEERLDGTIAYRGLVRFDAYNEMSGRQSTSIALLDARRSGVVISSIHHRDQARVYAKRVDNGEAELQLAPEEEEAMRQALSGEPAHRAAG